MIAILGEVASSTSLAGRPICQKCGVPMITPSSTNEKVTQVGDFIFRVCFIDPFQGIVMARFAAQSLRLNTVAILRDKRNDYSIGLANVFNDDLQVARRDDLRGRELPGRGRRLPRPADGDSSRTNPQALFVPGYYTEVGLIARQSRELGFTGPDARRRRVGLVRASSRSAARRSRDASSATTTRRMIRTRSFSSSSPATRRSYNEVPDAHGRPRLRRGPDAGPRAQGAAEDEA